MSETAEAKRAAPWRGRPRVPDPKDKFIGIRCTAEKLAAYEDAAAQVGLNVGPWLRSLADGDPGPRARRRPSVEKELLARLLGEIGKLGSNHNQLARAANIAGDIPDRPELAAIAEDIHAMRAAVMKALGHGD